MTKTKNPIEADFIFGSLATDDMRLASIKAEHSGLWHSQFLSPPDPRPGQPVTITIAVGPDISADRVTLYVTTDGTEPRGKRGVAQNGAAIPMEKARVEWDTLLWGYRDTWRATIPAQPNGTHVQYIIEAWQTVSSASQLAGRQKPGQVFGFFVDETAVPDWLHQAVIYQIFVDRFAPDPGADFSPADDLTARLGGTLKGITGKLDYLAGLGINCLWLTPIFESPTYHRYDATDMFRIDPDLGTEADFRDLVAEAHARGIRLVLDFVANHISNRHPIFVQAQQNGGTPYTDWFTFMDHPHDYDTFFGVKTMPKVNTDHPAARKHLLDAAVHWLKLGVDGYRLDHAQGPTHAFWSAFRRETRAVAPESVTFGEIIEPPDLQRPFAGRMDGSLDFLLHQALRRFFAFDILTASQFNAFLQRHLSYFPDDFALPSFLDNHDMNRFLWVAQGDDRRLKLAALCQFTLPGPPTIYYGTEVGLSQQANVGRMEECRLPMPWDESRWNRPLFGFYEELIALRHTGQADWRGPRTVLALDDERGLYAYRVGRFTVVLNNGPQPLDLTLPDHGAARLELATVAGVSWAKTTGNLRIPPFGGVCLKVMA